jgi:UDP-N-acetylmuramate--alanine ligase
VALTPIYAARERDTLGISTANLAAAMKGHPHLTLFGSLDEATARVLDLLKPGDVLITLGAGDVNRVGRGVIHGTPAPTGGCAGHCV